MDDSASVMSAVSMSTKFPLGEPNDDWTVEELIHWSLSQYQSKTTAQANEYIDQLRDHCDRECQDIMSLHTMALEMAENNNASSTEGKSPKITREDHIEVIITTGPHAESKFDLCPKPNAPCFVGRSKGKKFIRNGISLHKDQEVSTTHAKIIVEGMGLSENNGVNREVKFYFMDVGSTNGSCLEGEMLVAEEKVLIAEGMEVKVGGSTLKFILG